MLDKTGSIDCKKIIVREIFSGMWFRIPKYQRPYVWGKDQVMELLEDTTSAMLDNPESEYFLGSFVCQSQPSEDNGIPFTECDLLDGQQRMTTLLLLFAVLRDRTKDKEARKACQNCIYQPAQKYQKIPERARIVFGIRDEAHDFVNELSKNEGFTNDKNKIAPYDKKDNDVSVRNMIQAIRLIRKFFDEQETSINLDDYFDFLLNKILLVYIAAEDFEDAFRLFMILNNRGVPLRNSDILKSINLRKLKSKSDEEKYAKLWEDAESELEAESESGDNFDLFLSHVRTILVKEKARLNLYQEYKNKIYKPKDKPPLLKKGKETFEFIKLHLGHYRQIFSDNNYDMNNNFEFDNLIKVMSKGLLAKDWVPPLLRYYDKFKEENLYEFLVRLDNKFSTNWIIQLPPTSRIEKMNDIIKKIDASSNCQDVLRSETLTIDETDENKFLSELNNKIYGRRFARYILLKLDFLYHENNHKISIETISVEHILPQTPAKGSQWEKDFNDDERAEYTNMLGNLVLISKRKNSEQGRLDYKDKKEKYFKKVSSSCANSLRVMRDYDVWNVSSLQKNQNECVEKIREHYQKCK